MTIRRFLYVCFGALALVAVLISASSVWMQNRILENENQRRDIRHVITGTLHLTFLLSEYPRAPERVTRQWRDKMADMKALLPRSMSIDLGHLQDELATVDELFSDFQQVFANDPGSDFNADRVLRVHSLLTEAIGKLSTQAEQLVEQRAEISVNLQRQHLILTIAIAALLPGFTLLLLGLVRGRLLPGIQQLQQQLEEVEQGRFDTPLKKLRRDEIGRLTESFDHMRTALHRQRQDLDRAMATLENRNQQLEAKQQEVETFVYAVSHDLRGPLVNLLGFASELQMSLDDLRSAIDSGDQERTCDLLDDDVVSSMRFITTNGQRLERLINALLNLSRIGREELKPERVDLNAVVDDVLEELAGMIASSATTVEREPLPEAWVDPLVATRVFTNLISNAVKYRSTERASVIRLTGSRHDDVVRIAISDNGLGIPKSALSRLFTAFQRYHPARADGEGMGLINSRRMTERSGGDITVETSENVGTTFTVHLPAPPLLTSIPHQDSP